MGYNEDYFREYAYEYVGPSEESIIMTIFLIYLAAILIVLVVKLVNYLLKAFAMHRMAQREGMEYPWLAFIPFARYYLQGELSGDIKFQKRTVRSPGIWMIVLPIMKNLVFGVLGAVLWGIGMGTVIAIGTAGGGYGFALVMLIFLIVVFCLLALAYTAVYKVLCVLVDYQIFHKFTTETTAIVHSILSVTVPLYEAICLLVYRNKSYNAGMEPDLPKTPEIIPPILPLDHDENNFVRHDEPENTSDQKVDHVNEQEAQTENIP